MEDETRIKLSFRLTWCALVVSIISLALFAGLVESSGDTSIALWFMFLLLLLFVSMPLHGVVLILALMQLSKNDKGVFRWVYLYLVVTFGGHLIVAASQGAFDDMREDIAQFKRSMEEPAQVNLEQALRRGPSSNIEDVRDALANGADPDGGIGDNRIPFLVLAASRADAPVIKALLDAGADPNKRASIEFGLSFDVTINNPLPLDVVTFYKGALVLDSVESLLAAGADPSQSLMKLGACWKGDIALYDVAISAGAKGLRDAKGKTCLHHAAATNQLSFLQTLLLDPHYAGENTNEMLSTGNQVGQYPLDVAIAKKHFGLAMVILKAGGTTSKSWTVDRALGDLADDPALSELKTYLLSDRGEN